MEMGQKAPRNLTGTRQPPKLVLLTGTEAVRRLQWMQVPHLVKLRESVWTGLHVSTQRRYKKVRDRFAPTQLFDGLVKVYRLE